MVALTPAGGGTKSRPRSPLVNLATAYHAVMADVIHFPLHSRATLVRAIADELEVVHGPAANRFWRDRIAGIVASLRSDGLSDGAIRHEILGLQDAVQCEMQRRADRPAVTG